MKVAAVMAILLTFLTLSTSVIGLNNRQEADFFPLPMHQETGYVFEYNANPMIAKGCKLPRAGTPKPKVNAPKGSHTTNARPSTKGKHEKADGRRQREQAKAQEKQEQSKKRK
ncbi:MAG: hypothetical protein JSR80_00410 [Verrucomicrobia bacterium]|nr:hypothetical protein [Verrucomicrobiota bacterium]